MPAFHSMRHFSATRNTGYRFGKVSLEHNVLRDRPRHLGPRETNSTWFAAVRFAILTAFQTNIHTAPSSVRNGDPMAFELV